RSASRKAATEQTAVAAPPPSNHRRGTRGRAAGPGGRRVGSECGHGAAGRLPGHGDGGLPGARSGRVGGTSDRVGASSGSSAITAPAQGPNPADPTRTLLATRRATCPTPAANGDVFGGYGVRFAS